MIDLPHVRDRGRRGVEERRALEELDAVTRADGLEARIQLRVVTA